MNAFFIQLTLSPENKTIYVRKSAILSVLRLDVKESAGLKPRCRIFTGTGVTEFIDVAEGASLIVPQL